MLASNSDDDEYSDDNYDENEFDEAEDKEADLKLEKLRKALKRENVKASKVVMNINRGSQDSTKKLLKMGPGSGVGKVTMA